MRTTARPIRLVASAALAGLLLVQPGVASAATSSVTLTIVDATFKGRVSSPNASCIAGRRVALVRLEPDGSRRVIDTAQTGPNGRYATVIPMQSGNTYVAKVRRSTPGSIVCKPATSAPRTA